VEDVLLRPQHPYTRALLAAVPSTSEKGVTSVLGGEPPDPTAIPKGCRFHPRCPLRAILPEDKARECMSDVPVLPPGEDGRRVACSQGAEWARAARKIGAQPEVPTCPSTSHDVRRCAGRRGYDAAIEWRC